MLVNNVGLNDIKKLFTLSPQEIEDLIRVNIFTQVFMTKHTRALIKQNK